MCRKIESVTIYRIIKSIDPDALVTQGNVNGVYGKGFDIMKVKTDKTRQNSNPKVAETANSTEKTTR